MARLATLGQGSDRARYQLPLSFVRSIVASAKVITPLRPHEKNTKWGVHPFTLVREGAASAGLPLSRLQSCRPYGGSIHGVTVNNLFTTLCGVYLPIIYDVHTPTPVSGRGHPLTVPPDRSNRPFIGTTPSPHCSMSTGDQPRTNHVHSRWDGRGVSAARSLDTHPP